MTVKEIYRELDALIPKSLSCEWDNDGLMCCPDGNANVSRILVTLDVTDEAIQYAADNGFEMIVSHHPLLFRGLKSVSGDDHISAKTIKLIKANIAVASFHTRLDALAGGVNDVLANILGLSDTVPFGESDIGRVGTIASPMSLEDLAKRVKEALGVPAVLVADAKKPVSRVAVLGGEGGDDIADAIAKGADTMVSGRLGYHNMTDAREMGINLIEAGHYYTEFPICGKLLHMLAKIDEKAYIEIYDSGRIEII